MGRPVEPEVKMTAARSEGRFGPVVTGRPCSSSVNRSPAPRTPMVFPWAANGDAGDAKPITGSSTSTMASTSEAPT